MRMSHVLLVVAALGGLALYSVASEPDGVSQSVQAQLAAQAERIERLEVVVVAVEERVTAIEQYLTDTDTAGRQWRDAVAESLTAIEQYLTGKASASPQQRTLQEHLDFTQGLHIAEDVADKYAPHPSKEHLQIIRRLHEAKHQANVKHIHPPFHSH